VVYALLLSTACLLALTAVAAAHDFVLVTDEMLQNPDLADWLMWRCTLHAGKIAENTHPAAAARVLF
jgi:hypothetical protein